eukprot:gene22431-28556_t
MYINAQMSEKTAFASFNRVLSGYALIWFFAILGQLLIGGGLLVWLPMLYALFYSVSLRLHIVRRYQINEIGVVGEACTGYWCWYCSVAQMARHVYGYSKVLDGDGDPERADGYGPVQQV